MSNSLSFLGIEQNKLPGFNCSIIRHWTDLWFLVWVIDGLQDPIPSINGDKWLLLQYSGNVTYCRLCRGQLWNEHSGLRALIPSSPRSPSFLMLSTCQLIAGNSDSSSCASTSFFLSTATCGRYSYCPHGMCRGGCVSPLQLMQTK